ncbi:MAG: acyl-CoA dehydrogenase family protein, partial [Rhodococcus sp. (in: high G+C Gram-positive bacteria)]
MDFTRNQPQTTIADMVIALLAREPADLWSALSDAGVFTMLLPETVGGDGLGMAEGATVLTELARRAAVGPALATIGYGLVPLARFASHDIVDAAAVPGGILTGAISEPGIAFPARPSTTTVSNGDRLRITGTKIAVPYAEQAHRMLVATSSGIVLVDPGGDGVRMAATPSSTGDPEYVVEFDSAPGLLVTEDIASYYRLVVAAIGAVADGLAAGAAELTAKYLASRHQFGKPLATFQAVAGEIADVYVTARTVHVAAVACVWQADRDR